MANYESTGRTNYFRVRDLAAFRADLVRHDIEAGSWEERGCDLVLDDSEHNTPPGAIALFAEDGWPELDPVMIADETGRACGEYEPSPGDGDLCQWCERPKVDHAATEGTGPYHDSFLDLVAAHVAPGDVVIAFTTGREKMRYLDARAEAFTSDGRSVEVDLDEIYERAKELGGAVTLACD